MDKIFEADLQLSCLRQMSMISDDAEGVECKKNAVGNVSVINVKASKVDKPTK